MASEPLVAEAVIRVTENMQFDCTYRGSKNLMIAMLGAIRYFEQWCTDELSAFVDQHKTEVAKQQVPISLETELPRDEAFAYYANAALKLKDRIEAIKKSDPQAKFSIDTSLLENL